MTYAAAALLGSAIVLVLAPDVGADTIFDVEHARANYRAGLISGYDEELLERWGRPSGNYPDSRFAVSPRKRLPFKKRAWETRRW